MNLQEVTADIDDEFARYFRAHGLDVTWDFSRNRRERWYEILKDGKLLVQVDMGTPLAAFLEDLPHFAKNQRGTSAVQEYEVNGPPENFGKLLRFLEQDRGM